MKIELRESMKMGKYEKNGEFFDWYYLEDEPIGDLLFADAEELGIKILLDGVQLKSADDFKKAINKSKRVNALKKYAK